MVSYGSSDEPISPEEELLSKEARVFSGLDGLGEYSNEPLMDKNKTEADSNKIPNVEFADDRFKSDFSNSNQSNYHCIERMLLNLALNHAVMLERASIDETDRNSNTLLQSSSGLTDMDYSNNSSIKYNASSPDELALVNGARYLGVIYQGRDDLNDSIFKISFKGQMRAYELLSTIEFSSARKRMTSVFREKNSGRIVVMCKGADSVLIPLLRNQEQPETKKLIKQTIDYMNQYAREGLRTLLIVEKTMSEEEFAQWNEEYQAAMSSVADRESKLEKCALNLEKDFDLVGSTALEDKLQDGVPDTIDMIRRGGIKLWVLTGDKIETAINIGYASKLLDDNMNQYIIDGQRSVDVYKQLCIAENKQNLDMKGRKFGLIVSGDALTKIFQNDSITPKFTEVAGKADVLLACRVSPKQKAEIVQMVRKNEPNAVTLAVGDGANDVNMITQAHIGIGLEGLEGMQAARASDYAIS